MTFLVLVKATGNRWIASRVDIAALRIVPCVRWGWGRHGSGLQSTRLRRRISCHRPHTGRGDPIHGARIWIYPYRIVIEDRIELFFRIVGALGIRSSRPEDCQASEKCNSFGVDSHNRLPIRLPASIGVRLPKIIQQ